MKRIGRTEATPPLVPLAPGRGASVVVQTILRLVRDGCHDRDFLRKAVSGTTSRKQYDVILGQMQAAGLVVRGRFQRVYLTARAFEALPQAEPAPFLRGEYRTPATPPRRPGSDTSSIPSIMSGAEVPHWRAR